MKIQIIKICIALFLISLGYICIRFGDKQFGKYSTFTKLLFRRYLPDKIQTFGDKIMGWIFGIFFIVVGILFILNRC